ncbi:MAG: hypothetical protein A3I78_00805 [Gammaproteobacteria bacterium RIFCSPLOWO2_02_FULL_56_15]|nr:MAG: hypothetical protein A3I78_00805 [Gammaproteobacteria bacterium RIFCSPLOWO2_02_FULL_56_15]
MTKLLCQVTVALLSAMACTAGLLADENPPADIRLKKIDAVRVDTAPVIDGRLDEDLWRQAAVIEDAHQVQPHEYGPPEQKTVFLLMYDEDAFYVGVRAFDTEPERMTARVLRQGSKLIFEDRVGLLLDPFNDKRSGYMFELNPNGVRLDGIYNSPTEFAPNWDGIWEGDAQITADGYTAEFAIPFKTLAFDKEDDTWGLNVWRVVMRNEERDAWVSYNRATNPAASGEVGNMQGMDFGKGLDITPSVSLRQERNIESGATRYRLEPSLDVFYKITPSLNGSLTINTDFSATEIDDRQVNLTRFNLFFPEKRDFFLKDCDIFEFAQTGNGQPFFSRRIGLSPAGDPVDLEFGGKISGRLGQWNIGTLAIRQGEYPGVDASDIFVGRVTRNVLEESTAGVIMTWGDPASNRDAMLGGVDFRYLNTRLPGGQTLTGNLWYQQTETEGLSGDNAAWGIGISMPNQNQWRGGVTVNELQQNFHPALGFANRTGVRQYAAGVGYTHRFNDGWIRELGASFDAEHIARLSDEGLSSQSLWLRLINIANFPGDRLIVHLVHMKEGLDRDYPIYAPSQYPARWVILPPGLYTFNRLGIQYSTSPGRAISASGYYWTGSYYNGTRWAVKAALEWRPNKHIGFAGMYDYNDIDLKQGDFITRLITFQSDLVFSNTLSWSNLIQFDNVSGNLGLNSRLHWTPEAGRNVYLVFNYNMIDTEAGFHSTRSDITLKANYTFRF